MNIYEVLVVSPDDVQWLRSFGRLDLSTLGARPVEGGYEEPTGEPLYIAQGRLAGEWRTGKASAELIGNRRKTISVTAYPHSTRG